MQNSNSLKRLLKLETWHIAFIAFVTILSGTSAFAQTTVPEKVDVNINTGSGGGGGWYAQPWVWVVGVAVFIIIIIAITRSGGSKREV